MTKHIKHALHKKFKITKTNHKKFVIKELKQVNNVSRGIGVNNLTDFAGSHYRDDGVRHIHKEVMNKTTEHIRPKIGNEINNLIPFDMNRKLTDKINRQNKIIGMGMTEHQKKLNRQKKIMGKDFTGWI